ncbi:NAD(P)H-dependent oxidoreductase [Microbacterium terricola]|uniref:NAD(P)H dehydrogenase n=1 Tax=Microbacterium terricola TaxID=344163 RepID=A0ABM8DWR2_9MICO|nr:NAD(P)H-dependent oxidoreductase [Microbacterium terricola]UYK39327.1 NAD(P)H-dependent oxidoreductase [Microbacterium terricola]BDV29950.1 NAD(P)H dehydrogenase [Microbacterium terricola]
MTRRILVIIGTPLPTTLTHALATAYIERARVGGADVRVIDLAEDPIPGHPTSRDQLRAPRTADDRQLDPEVAAYLGDVQWAEHVALFFPQWWGTYPAALKAFIDRVFLSNAAFRYRERSAISDRLLTGRTARLVMTMDSPRFWNRLVYRNAAETSLTKAILGYCGIRTTGITRFTPVRFSETEARAGWVAKAAQHGATDATASGSRVKEPAPTLA